MQSVKDSKRSALHISEFSMIIDQHSPGIELEAPPDSLWKVITHVIPARVCKLDSCHIVVNLMNQINMAVVLDYQPGRVIPQVSMEIKRLVHLNITP